MKKTNLFIGLLAVLFIAFGMLSMNQDYNPYFIARQGDSPAVGTKAPELAYENTEGKKVKLSSLKGKMKYDEKTHVKKSPIFIFHYFS